MTNQVKKKKLTFTHVGRFCMKKISNHLRNFQEKEVNIEQKNIHLVSINAQ